MEFKDETRNPLKTYLVMKNILKLLSFKELKSSRLVCKFWRDVALPILQTKSCINLSDSSVLTKHINYVEDSFNCRNNTSFQNYELKLPESEWEGLVLFQQFWENYAPEIKELSIEMPPAFGRRLINHILLDKESRLQKFKVKILQFFTHPDSSNHHQREEDNSQEGQNLKIKNKNLTSFAYSNYSFDGSDFIFPMKWARFINKFPNLKELLFTGISDEQLTEILTAILEQRSKFPDSHRLQALQILNEDVAPESPTNEHLQKIAELSLPLCSLSLEIGPQIDFSILQNLLIKYNKSLTTLQLRRYPFEINRFTFETILQLNKLNQLDISDKFVNNLNFLNSLPNLTTFKISIRDYRSLVETDIIENTRNLKPVLNMRRIIIEPLVDLEDVRKIIKWFPQLESLKLRVDDVMARLIFMGLKNLTEAYFIAIIKVDHYNMNRSTLTDEGITGIPLPILQQGNVNPDKDRILPYIGDLKYLEKLTIESWHDYGNGITDFSIYFGLLDLKDLTYVYLQRTLVSSQGLLMLKTKPGMTSVQQQ